MHCSLIALIVCFRKHLYMYVCMYVYMYTCIHVHLHVHVKMVIYMCYYRDNPAATQDLNEFITQRVMQQIKPQRISPNLVNNISPFNNLHSFTHH